MATLKDSAYSLFSNMLLDQRLILRLLRLITIITRERLLTVPFRGLVSTPISPGNATADATVATSGTIHEVSLGRLRLETAAGDARVLDFVW
jgi:hypothetical protein